MIKYIFITIGIFFCNLNIWGQTVFDIEIDELHLTEDGLRFINTGETNSYDCELIASKLKDFKFQVVFDNCDEIEKITTTNENESTKLDFKKILEFKDSKKYLKSLNGRKFGKKSEQQKQKQKSEILFLGNNLIAELNFRKYNNEDSEWEMKKANFWDYTLLRINKKYLIIALIDQADPGFDWTSVLGFLIPMKDNSIVLSDHSIFEEKGNVENQYFTRYLDVDKYFRKSKTNSGYQIKDKLFEEIILEEVFDEVKFSGNYVYCRKKNKLDIYNKSFSEKILKNIDAAYDTSGTIHFIKNNKLKWMDANKLVHDTFPKRTIIVHGMMYSLDRRILKFENGFYEESTLNDYPKKKKRDTTFICSQDSIQQVLYLNNTTKHHFGEGTGYGVVYNHPYSYLILKSKKNDQLISFNKKNKNSPVEVLLKGDITSYGYYHPIKFESENLYGYFPQNKKANYSKVEKFNFYFAKIKSKSGRNGWLDIYGNEFF